MPQLFVKTVSVCPLWGVDSVYEKRSNKASMSKEYMGETYT